MHGRPVPRGCLCAWVSWLSIKTSHGLPNPETIANGDVGPPSEGETNQLRVFLNPSDWW